MSFKCAGLIAKWLIACKAISDEEYDLYVYAAHSLILTFAPLILAVAVGMVTGRTMTAVEIIFPFMVIRKFSGGFHAGKPWICMVFSTVILCMCISISDNITYGYGMFFLTFVAAVLLAVNSPIGSENKMLDEEEKRMYKRVTVVLTGLCMAVGSICYAYGNSDAAKNVSIGIVLAGGLQIPYMFKRIVQKVYYNVVSCRKN